MLLFGGIELLFPDADGELAKFLRDHQNVAESIEFAERRLSELSPRRGLLSWYGVRKGIGQTIANYPEPPKPELNTLYWPTGASRFARGFFLAAGAAKEAIVKKAHGGGANVPLTLKMGDQDNYFLETSMYLLPPRIVARPIPEQGKPDESLWILPLVDERYWWQERSTDDLEVTTSTTWASLFTTLGTKLGVTISTPTAVEAAYLQPDPIEFTRRYENVPAMLDAAALSVGKRIVRRIDGTVRAESAADALTAFQGNFDGNWRQICGGGLSAPTGATPAAAVTTFRRWRDYAILQKGKVHAETNNAPDGSVVVSGTKKQIHSTAYADFTASDSSPSNSSDLATLATAISTDYYAWLARLHDYTFAGVKPWAPTGFDDAIVWRFGCQGSAGEYQAQTRIQSLPVDFGFDLQLSQFSNRGLFEPVMLVKPDADIAIDGTGTVSVWTGRAGAKTDSTINVTAHAEFGATGGVFAVMRWIEDDWEIEVAVAPVQIVEVYHSGASSGDIVEANSDGYHPGRIRLYDGTDTYDDPTIPIWIQFVDGFDGQPNVDGNVLACNSEYYGPAKPAGTWDKVENEGEESETHDERPVYVVECSEREFLCKADSAISKGGSGTVSLYHSHDETDSGINRTAKALFAAIETGKWCLYHRIAGVWYVSKAEC